MMSIPLLTINIFLPFFSAVIILLGIGSIRAAKIFAVASSVVTLIISLYLYRSFSFDNHSYQFEDIFEWFERRKIMYHVGVDAISLPFIILTNVLMPIALIGGWNFSEFQSRNYVMLFLVLQTLILGAFSAVDIILFYVFFEAILIPMFFIIGIWGGDNRVYAAYKFFLYTLFGSVFLLVAIVFAYYIAGTANIPELIAVISKESTVIQQLIWLGFFASFAVKIPMWPVHTWLPDAHVEAPTTGSMILAGILLKMGGYGFLRVSLPMLPQASHYFADFVAVLSVIAIIYASFVAFAQTNMKKTIAYSSIAHMGYVTLAIFSGTSYGIQGAVFQMISHGLISAGLFFAVGILSEQTHSKEIKDYGGVASVMPNFAIMLMILILGSVALPGTSGFIGEFLSLIAAYHMKKIYAFLAVFGVISGAVYMLSLYKNTMFGKLKNSKLRDVIFSESFTSSQSAEAFKEVSTASSRTFLSLIPWIRKP